ncbi:MAG TPA: glycosyltransferase [Chryseosolibacter sp.]|nr:glycosyltransferase [Chryseosolibacter sp.]
MLPLISLFGLFAFVQLFYLLIFSITISKKRPANSHALPPVSILVCAHDEEENLKKLIPDLLNQDYPDFEVIVVNDRSNDNTYDYLRELSQQDDRLKMVNVKDTPSHVNGKKYAITLGIRAAANDWIVLTDADCRPVSNLWVRSMADSFTDDAQFVLGFAPYQTSPGFLNHFIRFETVITALQFLSLALMKNPYMGVGRNLAYRKSLFLAKKGFNNFLHVIGGDDDLFVNQHATGRNTRVHIAADAITTSVPEKTWTDFFYQKVRHLSVGKYYKSGHKVIVGLFKISWVLTLFVGFTVLSLSWNNYVIAGAIAGVLLCRWILLGVAVNSLIRKAGLRFNFALIPVLDIVYPIYYISTGLVAFFTKKVRWKT